jgi:hypothetical protein
MFKFDMFSHLLKSLNYKLLVMIFCPNVFLPKVECQFYFFLGNYIKKMSMFSLTLRNSHRKKKHTNYKEST